MWGGNSPVLRNLLFHGSRDQKEFEITEINKSNYVTVICIATRLWLDDPGFDSQQRQEIFLLSKMPDWLWGPPSLLSMGDGDGDGGVVQSDWNMKLHGVHKANFSFIFPPYVKTSKTTK
jgi:hypothetical protein